MASEWMPRWTILITLILLVIGTINFLFAGISLTDTSQTVNNSSAVNWVSQTVGSLSFSYVTYEPARWILTMFFWLLIFIDGMLAWGWISSLLGRT